MNKIVYLSAFCLLGFIGKVQAQSMTFLHDESKQSQIEVMELGRSNLTPEVYYKLFHSSYLDGAKSPTSVKNTLRLEANVASHPQIEMADSIKNDLESRAKIEAANVADRLVDVAWLSEGSKIEKKLLTFKNNMTYLNGKAKQEEIDEWKELGKLYDFAIKMTKQAYMPNSERQKQYIAIYDEILKSNDVLLYRLRYLNLKRQSDMMSAAMSNFQHRVGQEAAAGYNRWHNAADTIATLIKSQTNNSTNP